MTIKNLSLIKWIVALLVIFIATSFAFMVWRQNSGPTIQPPERLSDFLFWEAKKLEDFTLMATENKPVGLDQLKEKWSFIFFGYTHCPDVCPTVLSTLGHAFKILERDPVISQEIQGIFISVDPKRDTPENLFKYASYFHPKITGITGNTSQIDAITRQMGALYTIHSSDSDGDGYLVSHNSTVFVVDPQGRLYGRFPPPLDPNEIADVFIRIRAFYDQQEKHRLNFF